STSVATMTSRISTTVHKVIDSVKNLKGLLGKLTELFRKFSDTLNRLLRKGADAPVNTKGLDASSMHSPKGAHPTTGSSVPEPHTRASELPRTEQEFRLYNLDMEHSDPLLKDTDAEWGRKPDHTPYTENEWTHEFVDPVTGDELYPDPPYVPGTKVRMGLDEFTAAYGTSVDRIGEPRGRWLAVAPGGMPVSFESRALPHKSLAEPHYSYTVSSLPEGCTFEVSKVAPGFGYSGGGTQIQVFDPKGIELTVKQMITLGILK
ncbi:MAG: TNT domain-containing protein, partial [Actinomycetaceae bacterium]|nr:TNT domain-containing protein [Actinomycetaceae bacterium]